MQSAFGNAYKRTFQVAELESKLCSSNVTYSKHGTNLEMRPLLVKFAIKSNLLGCLKTTILHSSQGPHFGIMECTHAIAWQPKPRLQESKRQLTSGFLPNKEAKNLKGTYLKQEFAFTPRDSEHVVKRNLDPAPKRWGTYVLNSNSLLQARNLAKSATHKRNFDQGTCWSKRHRIFGALALGWEHGQLCNQKQLSSGRLPTKEAINY